MVHTVSTSKEMAIPITVTIKWLLGRGNIYFYIHIYIYEIL